MYHWHTYATPRTVAYAFIIVGLLLLDGCTKTRTYLVCDTEGYGFCGVKGQCCKCDSPIRGQMISWELMI